MHCMFVAIYFIDWEQSILLTGSWWGSGELVGPTLGHYRISQFVLRLIVAVTINVVISGDHSNVMFYGQTGGY